MTSQHETEHLFIFCVSGTCEIRGDGEPGDTDWTRRAFDVDPHTHYLPSFCGLCSKPFISLQNSLRMDLVTPRFTIASSLKFKERTAVTVWSSPPPRKIIIIIFFFFKKNQPVLFALRTERVRQVQCCLQRWTADILLWGGPAFVLLCYCY